MKSEDNSEGNAALCEVYAFLLQRRRLHLAQEEQSQAHMQKETLSLEEDETADTEIIGPSHKGIDITPELMPEDDVHTDEAV